MLYNQYGYPLRRNPAFTPPAGGSGLQADVPSTCFVLEASNIDSTDGSSQTWSNVITSPADGSAQTDFDMYRGATSSATTDDPTFTGTAGVPGAYWLLDGGDVFTSITATPPGFLADIHKTTGGTAWWVAFAGRIPNASTKCIWSTQNTAAAAGYRCQSGSTENIQLFQHSGTDPRSINTAYTHGSDTDFIVIISGQAGGGVTRYWGNTRTNSTVTLTFATASTDPGGKFTLGGISPTATRLPNTSRIYGLIGGNDYIDDTAAGYIFDYMNTSVGVTFA